MYADVGDNMMESTTMKRKCLSNTDWEAIFQFPMGENDIKRHNNECHQKCVAQKMDAPTY